MSEKATTPRKVNRNEVILNLIARLQNDVDMLGSDVVRLTQERDAAVEIARKQTLATEQLEKMVRDLQGREVPAVSVPDELTTVGERSASYGMLRSSLAAWAALPADMQDYEATAVLTELCARTAITVSKGEPASE